MNIATKNATLAGALLASSLAGAGVMRAAVGASPVVTVAAHVLTVGPDGASGLQVTASSEYGTRALTLNWDAQGANSLVGGQPFSNAHADNIGKKNAECIAYVSSELAAMSDALGSWQPTNTLAPSDLAQPSLDGGAQ